LDDATLIDRDTPLAAERASLADAVLQTTAPA